MQESSGFGDRFGERLRAKATAFVSRSLRNSSIAVTELRSDNPERGISAPLVREDAYLIGYHFVDYPVHEYFEDERVAPVAFLNAGHTTLYDLKRNPQFTINKACHCVHFYFPRTALDFIADSAEARRVEELHYRPGVGIDDPTVRALTTSLAPAFDRPDQASRIFVDHVTLAVGIHVAKTYGGMVSPARLARGGLAPYQLSRAQEILVANLQGDISLGDLANECDLSASHFARAFRQSTGLSPHQWLIRRRVDEAKCLLRSSRLSLSEIALACGFGDQSHFTRVFVRLTGMSPGAWRRSLA